jgi:hypothetical protein
MCEPTSCGTLVYIHNNKNVSFTSDIFHHYIKACKNRRCDFAQFHFFLFIITGDAHKFFDFKHAHHRRKKKGGKRYRRQTPIRMSILTLVAISSRSSIFLSISCERDLAPSPAPTRHNFSKNRSAQFGGEIRIAIGESGGTGVTFGGIKQGGVELLLPPQQIRARHGWGTFSPTRQSRVV